MKINSINFSKGYPTVRFCIPVAEGQYQDATFPGKDSDDVNPLPAFEMAIDTLVEAFKEVDMADYDWRIKSIRFLWNDEATEYGYEACLSVFESELALTRELKLKQTSPDHISPRLDIALESVLKQAAIFASGKTAQAKLFDEREAA